MIIVCEECKGKVSDSAESCPHCGSRNYAREHYAKVKGFKSVEAMRKFEHKQKIQKRKRIQEQAAKRNKRIEREKIEKRKQNKIEKQKEQSKDLKVVIGVFIGFIVLCIACYLFTMKILDFLGVR